MQRFTIAALAAVLLCSTGAQAHDYKTAVTTAAARLHVYAGRFNEIKCSIEDYQHAVTCYTANTTRAAADLLDTIKPDATNEEAENMVKIVERVLTSTVENEIINQWMFAQLKGQPDKLAKLADALDETTHTIGALRVATTPNAKEVIIK
ncbi:hypothetical protein ACH54D_20585 [Atlantibacter hermannii]|uniref:hypothetical protein n=1 Tax=Atlantibacter hermannii TaxID=565 RepID=UPI00324F6AB4